MFKSGALGSTLCTLMLAASSAIAASLPTDLPKTITMNFDSCNSWTVSAGEKIEKALKRPRLNDKGSRGKFTCVDLGRPEYDTDEYGTGKHLVLGEVYKCTKNPYNGDPIVDLNMVWEKGYRAPRLIDEDCAKTHCNTSANKQRTYSLEYISCDMSDHICRWFRDSYLEDGSAFHWECSGKY